MVRDQPQVFIRFHFLYVHYLVISDKHMLYVAVAGHVIIWSCGRGCILLVYMLVGGYFSPRWKVNRLGGYNAIIAT